MTSATALLKRFKNTKTLPHVAIRLTHLMADENSSAQAFEGIIKMDPTLVLRLLRMVNSPYYGVQQKIESIARAVVFIGMKNLRNIVVTEALRDIFKEGAAQEIFSRRQLWLHCAAMGVCCQMIAERIFGDNGENAFLCGILHDIGLIVQDQVVHDQLIQVCEVYEPGVKSITEYEEEIIGVDHSTIGQFIRPRLETARRGPGRNQETSQGVNKHRAIKHCRYCTNSRAYRHEDGLSGPAGHGADNFSTAKRSYSRQHGGIQGPDPGPARGDGQSQGLIRS